MKRLNILICGIGGQGVVLLGNFLRSYFFKQFPETIIVGTESRGVAQREGSVTATVKVIFPNDNDLKIQENQNQEITKEIHMKNEYLGPEISENEADIIIALETIEMLRNLKSIKPNAIIIANNNPIVPKNVAIKEIKKEKSIVIDNKDLNFYDSKQLIEKAVEILNLFPKMKGESEKIGMINEGNDIDFKWVYNLKNFRIYVENIFQPMLKKRKKEFDQLNETKIMNELYEDPELFTFSKHPILFDANFTSLLLKHFGTPKIMNLAMLGFCSAFLPKYLDLHELLNFLPTYFGNSSETKKIIEDNSSALLFGWLLAKRIIEERAEEV